MRGSEDQELGEEEDRARDRRHPAPEEVRPLRVGGNHGRIGLRGRIGGEGGGGRKGGEEGRKESKGRSSRGGSLKRDTTQSHPTTSPLDHLRPSLQTPST